MKATIEHAIEMARKNESLKGIVIENLNDTQVSAANALLLAEQGVAIPEQNIYYDDNDIAYDPDFDETEWSKEPVNMTWDEKIKLAEKTSLNSDVEEEVSVRIKIADRDIRQWVYRNRDKMGLILADFIVDIYKANKIIQK